MPYPFEYSSGIQQALEYVVEAHKGQTRKAGVDGKHIPYVVHPIEVMKRVWSWGLGQPVFLVAALLHDVLEDCPAINLETFMHPDVHLGIQKVFGKEIADIVVELTFKDDGDFQPTKTCGTKATQDSKKAKEEYMNSFQNKSLPSLLIKLSDRFCNVHDFMITSPSYAWKYLRKADSLLNVANRRKGEIIERYGQYTIDCIKKDYTLLCMEINNKDVMNLFQYNCILRI